MIIPNLELKIRPETKRGDRIGSTHQKSSSTSINMAYSRVIVTTKFAILAIIIALMATQQLRVVESIRLVPSDRGCQRGLDLGMAESSESTSVIPNSETLSVAHGSSSMAAHSESWKLHIQSLVNKAPSPPSGNPTHNR